MRDFPDRRELFLDCLTNTRGRYAGSSRLLVRALRGLGWNLQQGETFADVHGRCFDLVLTSMSHVESLLLTSWADRVVQEVCHRKGLEVLDSLDVRASRPDLHLSAAEKGMMAALVTGRHFTCDAISHFGKGCPDLCPFCGGKDSREHRVYECQGLDRERNADPLVSQALKEVPREVALYGLWPELEGIREWQAELDGLPMTVAARTDCDVPALVFTDGSCLFPRVAELRWASYACVQWFDNGFQIVDCGTLPGSHQSIQRAELWAGVRAVSAFSKVYLFSDSRYFVLRAQKLIARKNQGLPFVCPVVNSDLWTLFWLALSGCEEVEVNWIPAHVDCQKVSGLSQFVALGNRWADEAARGFLHRAFARIASYRKVYDSYAWRCRWKVIVRDFQLRLARKAIGAQLPSGSVVEPFEFCPEVEGIEWQPEPCVPPDAGFHAGFLRRLAVWMQGLQWAVSTSDGLVADISWLELFWQWIHDTGCLPPVDISGKMVSLDEEPEVVCCLPDVAVLLGTWRKGVAALRGCGLLPGWGSVACTGAGFALGAREGLSGVVGRVAVSVDVCADLRSQFLNTARVSGFRLPSFWHL